VPEESKLVIPDNHIHCQKEYPDDSNKKRIDPETYFKIALNSI
jgi:hypothetical protein